MESENESRILVTTVSMAEQKVKVVIMEIFVRYSKYRQGPKFMALLI